MDGLRGAAAAALSAGFLFKRLLLVCLLSEVVYDSIFVTVDSSEPNAWQAVENTYENFNHQPTQNIHIEV
ncbi:hypothetical protein CHARACLAT_014079 [Characodon lateralis]|uniref:Uncharacterized protein n=1 Tax=Characodon lateralis TaxID=208331 RepID=A0ABU7ETK1_9TELE|nr:hypothetical protein [Characodon lateralis]